MTATVEPESKSPSRRALLAGALGGIGAWAAGAIGRATPVQAANGDQVILGSFSNTATTTTAITNSGLGACISGTTSGNGSAIGVAGRATSTTSSGYGVEGLSDGPSGRGVYGQAIHPSAASYGVYGRSTSTAGFGTIGLSSSNSTGVLGFSGPGSLPSAMPKTGVYGFAVQDSSSKGVLGRSPAGHGIHGESTAGWAGYFDGRVLVRRYAELVEIATPSAPGSNHLRLFARDKDGKTQLCVRFHNGTIRVVAEA